MVPTIQASPVLCVERRDRRIFCILFPLPLPLVLPLSLRRAFRAFRYNNVQSRAISVVYVFPVVAPAAAYHNSDCSNGYSLTISGAARTKEASATPKVQLAEDRTVEETTRLSRHCGDRYLDISTLAWSSG
jgi:hypothetical protein